MTSDSPRWSWAWVRGQNGAFPITRSPGTMYRSTDIWFSILKRTSYGQPGAWCPLMHSMSGVEPDDEDYVVSFKVFISWTDTSNHTVMIFPLHAMHIHVPVHSHCQHAQGVLVRMAVHCMLIVWPLQQQIAAAAQIVRLLVPRRGHQL